MTDVSTYEPLLSRSLICSCQTCDLRAFLTLVKGQWGDAQRSPASHAQLKGIVIHGALRVIHGVWQDNSQVNDSDDSLIPLIARLWEDAGGEGPPNGQLLPTIRSYIATDPYHLRNGERRILFVEKRLTATYRGHKWQGTPDLVNLSPDGSTVEIREWSTAADPLLNLTRLWWMATTAQLLLSRSQQIPEHIRSLPKRVLVCHLTSASESDVTVSTHHGKSLIEGLESWIAGLRAGDVRASPSERACSQCPHRVKCPLAWVAPVTTESVRRRWAHERSGKGEAPSNDLDSTIDSIWRSTQFAATEVSPIEAAQSIPSEPRANGGMLEEPSQEGYSGRFGAVTAPRGKTPSDDSSAPPEVR